MCSYAAVVFVSMLSVSSEWTMQKDKLWDNEKHHPEWRDEERYGDDVHFVITEFFFVTHY